MYKLFVYCCNIFPVFDPNEHISTIYNCYVILTTYMLDSALEPSYDLSKNLILLPWILKLVNDSTLLNRGCVIKYNLKSRVDIYKVIINNSKFFSVLVMYLSA